MKYSELIEDLRAAPFVRLFAPLAFGIIFQIQFVTKPSAIYLCLAFLFASLLSHFFVKNYAKRWCFGVAANLCLFFAGMALVQNIKSQSELPTAQTIFVEALVVEEPTAGARFTKLNIRVTEYQDSAAIWHAVDEKMLVYLRNDSANLPPQLGDKIIARLKPSLIPHAKNPYEFDYGAYLNKHQIFVSAFINPDSYKVLSGNHAHMWQLFPVMVRNKLLTYFSSQGLKGDELAVLQALTIGDKSLLDSDLKQLYMDTGAMHILAVSGMHVGIISMILGWLLMFMSKRKYGRIVRGVLVLVFIWLYALVAGMGPSILRATIMFSVVTIGGMLNRSANTYNSLAFSAFLLCLFDPYSLFDAGFQLSYAAVISIVFFYPYIYRLLHFKRKLSDAAWSLVAVAIAANIGTFPVTMFLFHQFPVHFILMNVLSTIPTMTAMAGFMATLAFMYVPIPQLGWVLAKFTEYSIMALNGSIRLTEHMPFSRVEALWLTPLQAWLLLLCIVSMAIFMWSKRTKIFLLSLTFFLLCLGLRVVNKYKLECQKVMTVYSVKNTSLITFVNGRQGFVLCDSADMQNNFDFNCKNHMTSMGFAGLKSLDKIALQQAVCSEITEKGICQNFIYFSNKTIKILENEKPCTPRQPLSLDYLVLTSKCHLKPDELMTIYQPKQLIIDASVSAYNAARVRRYCAEHDVPCYCVRDSGAFVQTF